MPTYSAVIKSTSSFTFRTAIKHSYDPNIACRQREPDNRHPSYKRSGGFVWWVEVQVTRITNNPERCWPVRNYKSIDVCDSDHIYVYICPNPIHRSSTRAFAYHLRLVSFSEVYSYTTMISDSFFIWFPIFFACRINFNEAAGNSMISRFIYIGVVD